MRTQTATPAISIILSVDAHDQSLPEKLAGLRAIDYPREKFDVIFIAGDSARLRGMATMCSTMQMTILNAGPNRDAELKQAVGWAQSDILVFGAPDDHLAEIAGRFADPRLRETRLSNGVTVMRREQFEKPAPAANDWSLASMFASFAGLFTVRGGFNWQRAQ